MHKILLYCRVCLADLPYDKKATGSQTFFRSLITSSQWYTKYVNLLALIRFGLLGCCYGECMMLAVNMRNQEFITVRVCNCHRVSTIAISKYDVGNQ